MATCESRTEPNSSASGPSGGAPRAAITANSIAASTVIATGNGWSSAHSARARGERDGSLLAHPGLSIERRNPNVPRGAGAGAHSPALWTPTAPAGVGHVPYHN